MKEEAYKTILDREGPKADIEKHFHDSLELLREVVNYGTNLIPRAYQDSKRDLTAAVILGGFLKQAVAMVDAVEMLISQGAVLASHVPARSLLEVYFYILWILHSDTGEKTKQYYVWTLRQRRMWASRLIPGTKENKSFQKVLGDYPAPASQKLQQEAQAQVKEFDRILAKNVYKSINDEFENLKGKRSYDLPWYQPSGARSIGDMATRLGRSSEYRFFYSQLSNVTHSGDFAKHVRFEGNALVFEPIRHLEGIKTLLNIVINLAIRIYRDILSHYRFGELDNFARKYKDEWRERFFSIKDVKYKTTHGDPI